MTVTVFTSGPLETHVYLISCPVTGETAIIDPAPDSAELMFPYIEQHKLKPTKILITHSHWDHIADVDAVKKKYHIPLYIHPSDAPNMINPGSDGMICWMEITGVPPDGPLNEGDSLAVGKSHHLNVIHTPGHTPGCVCFYCPEKRFLISGDTLFKGSIGNLSFPTAQPDAMWGSLRKLAQLPPETCVYPGHGDTTTIGAESWLANAKAIFG